MKKLFLLVLFVIGTFGVGAQLSFAQGTPDTCAELKAQFEKYNSGEIADRFTKYCTKERAYDKVVGIMYGFIGIFAVIILIYGGYVYMFSRGNEAQAAKGRQILTWAVVGLAVVIMAAVLVNIVVRALQSDTLF